MGALHSGVCYPSPSDAARAVFSAVGPVAHSGGSVSAVEETSPGVFSMVTRDAVGVVSTVSLSPPSFPVCDPVDSVLDASNLAWLVVGVWAMAWGVGVLRRSLA